MTEAHLARQHALEDIVRKSGADMFAVNSGASVVDPLAAYLRRHESGRRRK